MDALWKSLRPGRWSLLVAPGMDDALMLELLAHLARRGPVGVVDGGNRFRGHALARALGRRTPAAPPPDPRLSLARVRLARAFTCYQMVTLLEDLAKPHQPGQADGAPTVVLDLLATFYDESVSMAESRRLLARSLACLDRLSSGAPLAVSARPPRASLERLALLEMLESAAGQIWRLEAPEAPPTWRLFD